MRLVDVEMGALRFRRFVGWPVRTMALEEVMEVSGNRVITTQGVLDATAEQCGVLQRALEGAGAGPAGEPAATLTGYLATPHTGRGVARTLLVTADRMGASDIHLEPDGDTVLVRARILGQLEAVATLPAPTAARTVAALKALAGCVPYRSDLVQEGRIPREGVASDVRASFLPTALGERVALRLFGRLHALEELGATPAVQQQLQQVLDAPSGLVLVSGANGSGKTTTLYALLRYLAQRRGGAHVSVEDPVEQRLRRAGVAVDQVELDPARGITGETTLAALLRQDVDVICVGEVRSAQEAALALRAAHTGRLVLAGLHAGSLAEARQRMLDLGVDPLVLGSTLRATLHQRLAPAPCGCGHNVGCLACRGRGTRRVAHISVQGPATAGFEVHG